VSKNRKKKDFKNRVGVVYSTDPEYDYTLQDQLQNLRSSGDSEKLKVWFEKKGRGGKTVTIVDGFTSKTSEIEDLAKTIKSKCGVGGSVKDRKIIIQGNFTEKIISILEKEGKTAVRAGG
jgi:translation initiation factor 1